MTTLDEIEEKTLRILKGLGFQVTGYYPYEHATNLVGNLRLPLPFVIPIKLAAQIAKSPLNQESVESFSKFGKNVLAHRLAIFHEKNLKQLPEEVQSAILLLSIDYVGGSTLDEALSRSKVSKDEANKYRDSLDILSPKRLAQALPELSHKAVPKDIQNILGDRFEPWELMEDAVYGAFSMCLGYETRKLGHERKFEAYPEGEVVTANRPAFALLYDCKSASDTYTMDKEDERAVIEYINDKKTEIAARYRCELRYFLIVGPDFGGDLDLRRKAIAAETGITLVLMRADALSDLSLWAHGIPQALKTQIDLRAIFGIAAVIDRSFVKSYAKGFDAKYQKLYGD